MNRSVLMCFIGLLVSLTACSIASARIISPLRVDADCKQADAICVGQVAGTSVGTRDTRGGAKVSVVFQIDRTLKGNVKPGSQITVTYYEDMVTADGVVFDPREYLSGCMMAFLDKCDGGYTFARQTCSTIPASKAAYSSYVQSADVISNLKWELMNSLRSSSKPAVLAALEQVSMLKPKAATLSPDMFSSDVRLLMNSTDKDIHYAAMSAGLFSGEFEDLSLVLHFLDTAPDAELNASLGKANMVITWLALVQVTPENLSLLAEALSSRCVKIRRSVSEAMSRSGGMITAPYLKLALEDPDPEVRYRGMLGLAARFQHKEQGKIKPFAIYAADPDKFNDTLNYWKNFPID